MTTVREALERVRRKIKKKVRAWHVSDFSFTHGENIGLEAAIKIIGSELSRLEEDVCEWRGKGAYITSCSDPQHIHLMIRGQTYCRSCGRKIRVVEDD